MADPVPQTISQLQPGDLWQDLGCDKHGNRVQVLRLDRLHPIISGNKWLKLAGWLHLAKNEGYAGIMTAGGPWSNHVHAAAYAAREAGLSCTCVLRAYEGQDSAMIRDLEKWGVELIKPAGKPWHDETRWSQLAASRGLLWIPLGGSGPEGLWSVRAWWQAFNPLPADEYWIPVGTGTTLIGMMVAQTLATGFRACFTGMADDDVWTQLQAFARPFDANACSRIICRHGWRKSKVNQEVLQSMLYFYEQFGIPTDIVYTGPMIDAWLQQQESSNAATGKHVVLVHTGGLQGNRSIPGLPLPFYGSE